MVAYHYIIVSAYNNLTIFLSKVPAVHGTIVFKEIKMQGFIISTYVSRWPEWMKQHIEWVKQVKDLCKSNSFSYIHRGKSYIIRDVHGRLGAALTQLPASDEAV